MVSASVSGRGRARSTLRGCKRGSLAKLGAGGQALERTFPPTKMNLNADSTSGTQVPLVVIWPPVCFEDSSKLREGTSCAGLTPRKQRCADLLRRTSASLLGQPPRPVAWGRAVGEVSSWGLAGGHRSVTTAAPALNAGSRVPRFARSPRLDPTGSLDITVPCWSVTARPGLHQRPPDRDGAGKLHCHWATA